MKIPVGEQLFRLLAGMAGGAAERAVRGVQGGQIGGVGCQIGADGARIGQRHAALQPQFFRGAVQAMQVIGIARPQVQGKGPFKEPGPQADIACQPRKPYGKQPSCHPRAASNRRWLPFCP